MALSFSRPPAVATSRGSTTPRRGGGRWRLRDWRLRTKLTAVLLVPLVLAAVLGVLRVSGLVRKAHDFAALARQIGFAQQLGLVVHGLQAERHGVVTMLAAGRSADPAVLQAQVQRVNTAVDMLRAGDFRAEAFPAAAGARWGSTYQAALSRLSGLAALRQTALRPNAVGNATARDAVTAYSDLIATLLDLGRLTLYGAPDSLAPIADGVKELTIAGEQASWQHAVLLTGILSGVLPPDQQLTLRAADVRFDAAADEFGQAVSPAQRQFYFRARAVIDRKRLLDAALDRSGRGAPLETAPGDWDSAAAGTVETIHQGEIAMLNELRTETLARSDRASHEAFWDGAVVVALLLAAVALLVAVVRSLLQPLRALRTAAFEVADRRLPEAVEQLGAVDCTSGPRTVDPVPVHSREEVGQVARAFDTVHAEAVRLAAEQAQLRSSLNEAFLNLSGRSQRLVQRQLQVIDELRRTAPDPALENSLVQLDRLGVQMRRHSENLLVLAGGTAHRGAQEPVAILDVLNNAVSEIDEFSRVTVGPPPAAMVAAPVVNDLVHLIAELLDNATSVTPPGTTVTLGAAVTEDKSLLVEITDSGPGLPAGELEAINARLASAPVAEVSASGQMGLFVVRELAGEHGITVRLRQRVGDRGLTATVLLPPSLVTIDLRVSTGAAAPDAFGWQLPLRVSVIDEATASDLFSPASISPASIGVVTSRQGRPRTALEEWRELFGHDEPVPERAADFDQLGGGQTQGVAVTDPLKGTSVPGQPQEVREEIFELVSAWFREQQSATASDSPSTTAPAWRSPFDEGWQAAQALRTPADHEFTRAGLPKRQPRAHLVSGADGRAVPPPGPVRTPDAVRGRLSRYQRGLRVGRHASIVADEHPMWTELAQQFFEHGPSEHGPVEHGPSEEKQQ